MRTSLEEGIKLHRFAGIFPEQFSTEAGRHREAVMASRSSCSSKSRFTWLITSLLLSAKLPRELSRGDRPSRANKCCAADPLFPLRAAEDRPPRTQHATSRVLAKPTSFTHNS